LELALIDKHGKVCPLDETTREELAKGLEKISKEIAETAIVERTKIEPSLFLFSGNSKSARKFRLKHTFLSWKI